MGDMRKVDFRAEAELRKRTIDLLTSYAATQVRFTFTNITFYGAAYFSQVVGALQAFNIGFRTGQVEPKAGANYRTDDDLIDVKTYDFGKQPSEEQSLIHECYHAWRDIQGKEVIDADGKQSKTYAVTDEAMAYLTGALFVMHRSGTTAPPSWLTPLRSVAHQVAAKLVVKKGSVLVPTSDPTVSLSDVYAMWIAVYSSPTYENLKNKPTTRYGNNGVG